MVLCPPFSKLFVGYRAYNPSYYQITENSVRCHTDALTCYNEAMRIKSFAFTWYNEDNVLELKDWTEIWRCNMVIKALDRAIELDPNDTKAWYNKGLAFYALGLYGEAIQAYKEATKIDSDLGNYEYYDKCEGIAWI
jgi:tetratricopeptide (TPR) repeat protein